MGMMSLYSAESEFSNGIAGSEIIHYPKVRTKLIIG